MSDSSDRKGPALQGKPQRFKANCYSLGLRKRFRFLGVGSAAANLHHSLLINNTINHSDSERVLTF